MIFAFTKIDPCNTLRWWIFSLKADILSIIELQHLEEYVNVFGKISK